MESFMDSKSFSRRTFLSCSALALGTAGQLPSLVASANQGNSERSFEKKVAGVVTIYRHNSHADVLLTKILQGWKHDGGPGPQLELASLYVDQFPKDDMAVALSKQFGFRLCDNIEQALTLDSSRLAVDGVLSIGEHGDYPYNDLGQHLYPRKRFFSEITQVFEKCGQVVPVFNDKHPGPEWSDTMWMYNKAKELSIPWMAGSSAPVGFRKPDQTLPWGVGVQACAAIGYSGLDVYGIHTLEFMHSILERRNATEHGIAWVQNLPIQQALEYVNKGTIDRDLLQEALNCAEAGTIPFTTLFANQEDKNRAMFLVGYADGLVVPVLMLAGNAKAITVAVRDVKGQQFATRFDERVEPRYPHFACLLKGVEKMVLTGRASYPVERNIITAGALDRLLRSGHENHQRIETPELSISYATVDYPYGSHIEL